MTTGELKPIKLQLQWVTQAQFAGYFAAVDQGYYRGRRPRRRDPRGRRRHRAPDRARPGQRRLRHRLGAQGAAVARAGRRHHRHRPDLPALRHAPGVEQGRQHRRPGRAGGQEGRQLGLRQRVRAVRRHDRGRPRPASDVTLVQQDFDMQALLKRRHRRRPGHDLQRVRPGARGREPRDRASCTRPRTSPSSTGTTSARRCCRTPSGPTPRSSSPTRVQGDGRQLRQGLDPGLDLLPRQP